MISRVALLVSLLLVPLAAQAAPSLEIAEGHDCGRRPPGAEWFYLGDPGETPYAAAARRVYSAVVDAFGGSLSRDPACVRVEVLAGDALRARSHDLNKTHGVVSNAVGFHQPTLGADSTVYVMPHPGQGIEVVMLHEVLHALSHRFTNEAGRRNLSVLVEGATEYLTRELASVSFGIPKRAFRTGYVAHLQFYTVLIAALGKDGPALLGQAYLVGGYDFFEKQVDERLGVSLREAGRALQAGDLATALQRIGRR